MAQSGNVFPNGAQETACPGDELDRVPLKQRLKLLSANYRVSDPSLNWENRFLSTPLTSDVAVAGEGKSEQYDSQVGCTGEQQMIRIVWKDKRHPDNLCELGKSDTPEDLVNKCSSSNLPVSTAPIATSKEVHSLREYLCVQDPVTVKIEHADSYVESSSVRYMDSSSQAAVQAAVNTEPQMNAEYLDELEHVVLKERLRRLLVSRCPGLTPTVLEEICAGAARKAKQFGDQRHVLSGNPLHDIDRILSSVASKETVNSSKPHQEKRSFYAESPKLQNDSHREIVKSDDKKTILSTDAKTVEGSPISPITTIKIETPSYDGFQSLNVNVMEQMSHGGFLLVKSEVKINDDDCEDELDHMLLRDRMKLFSFRDGPSLGIPRGSECSSLTGFPAIVCKPVAPTPSQSFKVNHPRKRRKTDTDSIELAMEEDAPGLLKVLIDKGIFVDEIKLFGEPETDDALEDSSTNGSFSELEQVMTKLFSRSQRESLMKLAPTRVTKGERAHYCLECLLSLVEQARYLRFLNWPAEWGWCRDLQSFIFVFERHNRLVLERPEYGFATYFFELVESFPIQWQIKRLIIAMKLTSCSRITIIENKPLMVGDDISEGEARVLMRYGWLPNTGLGKMLNYYDRVVHDRWHERDRSEWRLKIGKLLADGLNGGTITSAAAVPIKGLESDVEHPMEIKMELN